MYLMKQKMIMGLVRAVLICAALGLTCGKAHGSGSSANVLAKTPGETVLFNTSRDPAAPYTYLTWEISVSIYSFIIITANESVVTIEPLYRDRVTMFADGSLELRNLTLRDSRIYRVNITSTEGPEVSIVYELYVQEPVSDVRFSASPTDLNEDLNIVDLLCSASGSDLKFSFYNSTHTLPASSDFLILFGLSRNSTGPWGCEAYNLVSRAKSREELNFTFNYGPEDVTVETVPSLDVYTEGSKVTLRCIVVGDCRPEAEITWAHDSHSFINVTELVLDPIKYEDRGSYRCLAYNRKTERLISSHFTYISFEHVPEQYLSDWAIAGIAIGSIGVVIGSSAVVFHLMNRKK